MEQHSERNIVCKIYKKIAHEIRQFSPAGTKIRSAREGGYARTVESRCHGRESRGERRPRQTSRPAGARAPELGRADRECVASAQAALQGRLLVSGRASP